MYINPCRRRLACLAAVAAQKSPFGRMTLISGPEALLADRAVAAIRRQILAEAPATELTEIEAARLDGGSSPRSPARRCSPPSERR